MLKYSIYTMTETEFKHLEVIEVDEDDMEGLRKVINLNKDKSFYVWPMSEDYIWPLVKPKRRGAAKLSDRIIIKIFELRAKEGLSPFVIGSRLYEEDQIVVSAQSIANVLARKTYVDVAIDDQLLEDVSNRMVVRKKRNAITEEDKPKILELHSGGNGLSGREISRRPEFNYSDATINKFLRDELGFIEANGLRQKYNNRKL